MSERDRHTGHQVCEMAEGLSEDHIAVFWSTFFQFLLQIPAAVLILAKSRDLALQILKTSACKAVNLSITLVTVRCSKVDINLHSRSMSPRLCLAPCKLLSLSLGPFERPGMPSPKREPL